MEPAGRQTDIEGDGGHPGPVVDPPVVEPPVVDPGASADQAPGAAPPTGPAPVPVRHPAGTRASATWTAVVVGVIVFIALIIFIAGNTSSAPISFAGIHGHAPIAVMLLVAAVGGALVVVIAAAVRILQLRRQVGRVPTERVQRDAPVPEAPTTR
jgi:uncharacterized integral membrane protein